MVFCPPPLRVQPLDFFCVSLSTNRLSETFFGEVNAENTHKISTSITLTLLFRSVGALTLGELVDHNRRIASRHQFWTPTDLSPLQ